MKDPEMKLWDGDEAKDSKGHFFITLFHRGFSFLMSPRSAGGTLCAPLVLGTQKRDVFGDMKPLPGGRMVPFCIGKGSTRVAGAVLVPKYVVICACSISGLLFGAGDGDTVGINQTLRAQ